MGARRAERVRLTRVLVAVCLAAAPQGSRCTVRVYQNSHGEAANAPTLFESVPGFGRRGARISDKIHQVTQLMASPHTRLCLMYGQKLEQQVNQGYPADRGRGTGKIRNKLAKMVTWADKESTTACREHLHDVAVGGDEWLAGVFLGKETSKQPDLSGLQGTVEMRGFAGHLDLATPDVYGCSALQPIRPWWSREKKPGETFRWWTVDEDMNEMPRAVLIARSVKDDPEICTFETKVRNAQAAGYSLVIVYDSEDQPLCKMATAMEVETPSVLVSYSSGLALTAFINASIDPNGPIVSVDNTDPYLRGTSRSDSTFRADVLELVLICHIGFVFGAMVAKLLRRRLYPNEYNRSAVEEPTSGSNYSAVEGGMAEGAGNLSLPLLSSAPRVCTGVA